MDVPDYHLPEEAIAQRPAEPRDSARLLVGLREPPAHLRVSDLPSLLGPGDLLVLNTSRVVPARLALRKRTGGSAEVLLLEPLEPLESPEPRGDGPQGPARFRDAQAKNERRRFRPRLPAVRR